MRRHTTSYDPNLPSGKKFVAVHVQNEDPLYFLVEVKWKVCELLSQITKFLNLLEPELFGLAIRCGDSYIFLDPLEKLTRYAPKPWRTQNNGMNNAGHPLFDVFFRVQFYVDSYLFISDKVAKFYYYHQMRENVLLYGQSMSEERAFLLASYALQADYGNFNGKPPTGYFVPAQYFPAWVIDELGVDYIVRNLPALHCDLKGMTKSEAQSMFIKEASDPTAPHNFHLYPLTAKTSTSAPTFNVWLAITISGIAIYGAAGASLNHSATGTLTHVTNNNTSTAAGEQLHLKIRISFFPWADIRKLSFKNKTFWIRSTGSGRKFVYNARSETVARHLLWFSRASHQYYLMVQTKMKEMLRREAEINRRKYRESCISSNSSSGLSSGGSSTGAPSSKAASPFNFSSSANLNDSSNALEVSDEKLSVTDNGGTGGVGVSGAGKMSQQQVHGTSDLDISNSSVLGDEDSSSSSSNRRRRVRQVSVSVISNASSNTTSGIVFDHKLRPTEGGDDSDMDNDDSDLLMSLNNSYHNHLLLQHRHLNGLDQLRGHHQAVVSRAITLSGSSPQPVVSLESLAMSEPTEASRPRSHARGEKTSGGNLLGAGGKKHSISISNIMITDSSPFLTSPRKNDYEEKENNNNKSEVLITGEHSSKVLCLEINNESTPRRTRLDSSPTLTPDRRSGGSSSLSSAFDEVDSTSLFTSKSTTSGRSNVTVLSTILKPEAERLLKQGFEADDAKRHLQRASESSSFVDQIDWVQLKEFEKAEKEKEILNSLINNIPPPPMRHEDADDDDGDDDDEDFDSEDDDSSSSSSSSSDDDNERGDKEPALPCQLPPKRSSPTGKAYSPLSQEKFHYLHQRLENDGKKEKRDPIYENINPHLPPTSMDVCGMQSLPPLVTSTPTRIAPIFASTPGNAPRRTGMRIGVSSLSRPLNRMANVYSCIPQANQANAFPSNLSTFPIAGSEPNLSMVPTSSGTCWPPSARCLIGNKSDSVYDLDRRQQHHHHLFLLHQSTAPSYYKSPPQTVAHKINTIAQDSNNNIEPIYHDDDDDDDNDNDKAGSPTTSQTVTPKSNTTTTSPNQLAAKIRQRSSDLNLPLITALFNDSDLMKSLGQSQSLQQIPEKIANTCLPLTAGTVPITRSPTFRVDETLAMRGQIATTPKIGGVHRPTSWHLDSFPMELSAVSPYRGGGHGHHPGPMTYC